MRYSDHEQRELDRASGADLDRNARRQQLRCEEQGHDFENCCTFTFQIYQACKWCGLRR